MKLMRQAISLCLVLAMLCGFLPVGVRAEEIVSDELLTVSTEATVQSFSDYQFKLINPHYDHILTEDDFAPFTGQRIQTYANADYVDSVDEAAEILREQMKDRTQEAVVYFNTPQYDDDSLNRLFNEIFYAAMEHTGVPTEGDYLSWQWATAGGNISISGTEGDWNLAIYYSLTYYTTLAEEQRMDAAVEDLLSDLNLSGKSDYEKIKAIYDYICANVDYDYEHLEDESYTYMFTAYAALIDGTAVCQGFALLMYRLALELGVDCRFIGGDGGGPHGWNIVELENLYYNADSTWDEDQMGNYNYFLKCPANFTDHIRDPEFDTDAFHRAYPMSSTDYTPPAPHEHSYIEKTTAPTCTEQGYTTYICSCGDSYVGDYVDAAGHSFGSWYQTKAPTEEAAGEEQRDCNNCDHYETREIEKLTPATSGICGDDLTWEYNETTGRLTVSGTGEMYGGEKTGWTSFRDEILSVVIESGATSIGAYAFSDFTVLEEIDIPNTVMDISYNAFLNCSALDNVDLPENLASIGDEAFQNCTSLQAIEIPGSVTQISYATFMDCTNLASVSLPAKLQKINYHAFTNCESLKEIEIPDNVMDITYNAFDNCSSLESVKLPAKLQTIDAFSFRNCSSLEEIDIPEGVTMISVDAFFECTDLSEIHFRGNAPAIIETQAFYNVTADAYYPANNTTWTDDVMLDYGGNLTWIAEGGVVVPDNSCGENITWAFDNGTLTISGTETVARVNGNSVMDDYASAEETPWYAYQDQIVTVVIESTVDSVGKNAFAGCSNLTTVIIEEGVSEIDSTAFADCESLETCYYEGSNEAWEDLGVDVGEAVVHTESAEPEAHTETKTTVAPTCTEQGYDLYTCSCGAERRDNIVAATGHIWDEGTITKEPTAEESGIMTYECTVCKETREEVIPALGTVQRIAGADRIETALAVATELKAVLGVEKFNSIILAAGGSGSDQTKFADALSGSYLASSKKSPILLYTKGDLSSKNLTFIEENLSANGTIYLLGGNVSIPAEVEEALNASGYTTKRLGGADRYQTNLIILDEAGIESADEILIAGGQAFADSLSASATGLPIMLVNGTKTTLTSAQIEFLQGLNGKKVTILGGTAAVSADLEAAIEEAVGGTADRIYGDARENTSAMIAEKYFADADMALIAYSRMYPDGLAGGVLANALHAPLLLTKAKSESIANNYITEAGIEAGYVLGGTAVMTDDTARAVFGLDEDTIISQK